MQIQKNDTHRIILQTARCEFLLHGFKGASMRRIAKASGVTLSNIYNYFGSKDAIFRAVLHPLLKAFNYLLESYNGEDYLTTGIFTVKSYQRKMKEDFLVIIEGYREELKLLLFRSSGSSLENFRDTFTDRQTRTAIQYMERMKAEYPRLRSDVSAFFIHTVSSWWLTVLCEIISHDELSGEEMEQFLSEFFAYCAGGWKEVVKLK